MVTEVTDLNETVLNGTEEVDLNTTELTGYMDDNLCGGQKMVIYFSIFLSLLATFVTLIGVYSQVGIITSALISLYIWFLSFNGFTFYNDPVCMNYTDSTKTLGVKILYGIFCFYAGLQMDIFNSGID